MGFAPRQFYSKSSSNDKTFTPRQFKTTGTNPTTLTDKVAASPYIQSQPAAQQNYKATMAAFGVATPSNLVLSPMERLRAGAEYQIAQNEGRSFAASPGSAKALGVSEGDESLRDLRAPQSSPGQNTVMGIMQRQYQQAQDQAVRARDIGVRTAYSNRPDSEKFEADYIDERRKQIEAELAALPASAAGRRNSSRVASWANQSERTETERRREELQLELNELRSRYYPAENKKQFARLSADSEMSQLFDNARTVQSDMEKVLNVANAAANNSGNAETQDLQNYLAQKYGITQEAINAYVLGGAGYNYSDNGYGNIWQLYEELKSNLADTQGTLLSSENKYDFERMTGYEQWVTDEEAARLKREEDIKYAQEHPVLASVDSLLVAPFQSVDFLRNVLTTDTAHNNIRDLQNYVPQSSADMKATNFVQTVRGQVSQDIEENTDWELFGTNMASFLYNTGMSIGDSAIGITTFGTGSIYLMGLNAASATQKQVLDNGGTNAQAFWSGLAAGAAEAIFEKFSVDKLLSAKNVTGVKSLLMETAKQAGVEASEEMFTEIANALFNDIIMGYDSDFNKAIREYMSAGMTEEEAKRQAVYNQIANVAWAGAGGLLSGGLMGGGVNTTNLVGTQMADALAAKVGDGKTITPTELGQLWRANQQAQKQEAEAYFNGEFPVNPYKRDSEGYVTLPTQSQERAYQIQQQQYAYASKLAEVLREYGVKDVVVENMPEGETGRWEDGTVYISSKLDTAAAINEKVAHEISHAASEGDTALTADIISAMRESGQDVDSAVAKKRATYEEFHKQQGKSAEWIAQNVTDSYAADEVAADYIGQLLRDDNALQSLRSKPSLARKIYDAVVRLFKGASPAEQNAYLTLANKLRSIAGVEQTAAAQTNTANTLEGARYSLEDQTAAMERVAQMEPVAEISGEEFAKGPVDLTTQVTQYFDSLGNTANNQQIGEVRLTRRGVKSDIAHGIGRKKAASFAAVPAVIENGVVVDYQTNWKGRGHDTAVVAAPVNINGERHFMGVVLIKGEVGNTFYLHEVITEKDKTPSFKTGAHASEGTSGDSVSPILSLLNKIRDVKNNVEADGNFVYSYSAEKEQNKGTSTRQTLHADVTPADNDGGNAHSNDNITQSSENVNERYSLEDDAFDPDALAAERAANATGRGMSEADVRQMQGDIDEYWKLLHDTADPTMTNAEKLADEKIIAQYLRPQQTIGEKAREGWYHFKRLMVDSGEAVDRVAKAIGDNYLYSYYNMARASSNAAVNMIVDAQTDITGKRVGESLDNIFAPIREKGDDYYKNFELYMWHEHNVDRMSRRNEGKIERARVEFEEYKSNHPELEKYAEYQIENLIGSDTLLSAQALEYIRLRDAMRKAEMTKNKPVFDYDVSAATSRAEASELLRANPEFKKLADQVYAYIDNLMQYRIDSGLITEADKQTLKEIYPHYVPTYRTGESAAPQQKRKGVTQVGKTVGRASGGVSTLLPLHQALAQQTMSVVREGSKNRFGQRILNSENRADAKDHIYDIVEYEPEFSADAFDNQDEDIQKTNTFVVRDEGKMWEIQTSPALYDAVKALSPDPGTTSILTKVTRSVNNLFKELVTGYNPMFLVRNFFRDLQDAGFYSKNLRGFAKAYPGAVKEITTNGKYWQQYKALGGTYTTIFDYDTGTVDKGSFLKRNTVGRIETLNQAIEQAPRLAEFMVTVKKGDGSLDNLMEAMHNAADVTVNFGRSGSAGKWLNANLVPFLNPGIQGFDKTVRTITQTKGAAQWLKLVGKAALFGVLPGIINALLYKDDEEWDDLKERDKETNYLFKIGEGNWLKLPKGRTFAAMSLTKALIVNLTSGKEVNFLSYLKEMGNQVAPANPLENNILSAWFDAKLFDLDDPGSTWYGGDLESQRLQGYAPGERYDEKTDAFSKWLGGVTGLSPKKINYLLDQYSGVIGDILLPLMTPQSSRDPFTAAFVIDSVSSNRLSGEFYETMNELTYSKNGPDGDGIDEVVYRFWNKQSALVSDINAVIREIELDPDFSNKEKRELVNAQKQLRNALERTALDKLDEYAQAAATYYYEADTGDEDDDVEYAYRMANREVYGAEYALNVYNKSVYKKAQTLATKGVSYDAYFDMYFAIKEINEDLPSYEKGKQERNIIREQNLTDTQKLASYHTLTGADSRVEKFTALMDTDLSFDDVCDIYDQYAELDADEEMKAKDKASAFAYWLDKQEYSSEQKQLAKEQFRYFTIIPAGEDSYSSYTKSGLDADTANKVNDIIGSLTPLPGKDSVSDAQKMEAISTSGLSQTEQLKALEVALNKDTYNKVSLASGYGVTVKVYLDYLGALVKHDEDGNGSYKQDEITAALNSMTGLTNDQKAALWQLISSSSKPSSNPYSSAIGTKVKEELAASKKVEGLSGAMSGSSTRNFSSYATSTTTEPITEKAHTFERKF